MPDDLFSYEKKMPNAPNHANGPKKERRNWLDHAAVAAASFAALAAAFTGGVGLYQASIASDTEQRQLRAYIGVTPGTIENFGDSEKQTWSIDRKNFGVTPAYNVLGPPALFDIVRMNANLPTTFSDHIEGNVGNAFTIFPSMDAPLKFNPQKGQELSKDQIDLVKRGTEFEALYMGVVYYWDAFGHPHYTRYCYLFKGTSMTGKDADLCFSHNDSN